MPTFVNINPFETLVASGVPVMALQGFLIAMAALTVGGVLLDIMHKKMLNTFLRMQKKQKKKQKQMCLLVKKSE